MDRDELACRVWEKLMADRGAPACLEELARKAARIADILHAETGAQMIAGSVVDRSCEA